MKKIFIIAVVHLFSFASFGQLTAAFQDDTLLVDRDKLIDQTIHIPVKITALNTGTGATNDISFAVLSGAPTTLTAGNYLFTALSRTVAAGTTQIECPVTILAGTNASNAVLLLAIQMSYNNSATQTKTVILKISNKPQTKEDGSTNNHIMFLNAYNFDFGTTSLSSNYVGHLNFFVPSASKNKKWGFNTGVMKINYSQKDTSYNTTIRQNVYINAFDTLSVGLKYLRQINGYKTEKRNTVWSFYVQPMFEFTNSNDKFHVYAHAHLELLVSKWSSTTTFTNLKQDTAVFTQPSGSFVISTALTNNTFRVNSLSGYFGGGFTFNIQPWDGGSFFFQPTVGITSNKPSPSSTEISTTGGSFPTARNVRDWNSFYLVRAYYTHVIAKEKATAVVGVDIRGLLPLYAPQYAMYVGLNLSLDSIFGLLKSN